MQIQTTRRCHALLLEWLKLKRLTIPRVNEDVKQPSYTADENAKFYSQFEKYFGGLALKL